MPKITPFLWFDTQAEEAMNFYTSIFKDSRVGEVRRYGKEFPDRAGQVMTASFTLAGQDVMALNGGPEFNFNESISLFVDVDTQEEVDELWEKLTDGGEESQCGWLKDRFGLSWQIIPKALGELLGDPDPERAGRAMEAMLKMRKIDVATLRDAADNREVAKA